MPLLEINQVRHICASVRLDQETAAQVDQYAAFIQSSAVDVVDKALNYVFSKDRDFPEFLKIPAGEAGCIDSACSEGWEQWCARAAREESGSRSRRGIHVSGAGGQSVIGLLIPWQCKNGASHRKYFDTPPLEGYWQGTLVPRCEPS